MKCPNCSKEGLRARESVAENQFTCDSCGECYRQEGGNFVRVDAEVEDDRGFMNALSQFDPNS